ncbi:MAG: bifunctional glutamate N-acetyltransferase/amino-acid acetyltransferase ArgJ [Alphaproteobacteria bacterium]
MPEVSKSPLAPANLPELPPIAGVRLGTAEAGIKYEGRADVTFMTFPEGTVAAGLFTQSTTPGAPVIWSKKALKDSRGLVRGLVVNAGNANVFTGIEGYKAAEATARSAALVAGCPGTEVLVASTGVIGERLPYDRIVKALPRIKLAEDGWAGAATAIMTTDTFPKLATRTAEIEGQWVTINGIAKGSGMIEPNMATMLAYVVTDLSIDPAALSALVRPINERTFNAITVDGDSSTSDMLVVFATGTALNERIENPDDERLGDFKAQLEDLMRDLAQQVVRDGEGASKFITIEVTGAVDDESAVRIAKSVANSPLVKTAIAGEDANWGRVVMAVGKTREPVVTDTLLICFGGQPVTEEGHVRKGYDEAVLTEHLKGQDISLQIDLGIGGGQATVWTCDLTHKYIDINADYRS